MTGWFTHRCPYCRRMTLVAMPERPDWVRQDCPWCGRTYWPWVPHATLEYEWWVPRAVPR